MKLSPKMSLIVPALTLVACLAIPAAGSACQASHCEYVPGTSCRHCILDEGEAGAACRQVGSCGCYYFECGAAVAQPPLAASDWRSFIVGGQDPAEAAALPAAPSEASLAALFSGV